MQKKLIILSLISACSLSLHTSPKKSKTIKAPQTRKITILDAQGYENQIAKLGKKLDQFNYNLWVTREIQDPLKTERQKAFYKINSQAYRDCKKKYNELASELDIVLKKTEYQNTQELLNDTIQAQSYMLQILQTVKELKQLKYEL